MNTLHPNNGQEFRPQTERMDESKDSLFDKGITTKFGLHVLIIAMGVAGGIANKYEELRDRFQPEALDHFNADDLR